MYLFHLRHGGGQGEGETTGLQHSTHRTCPENQEIQPSSHSSILESPFWFKNSSVQMVVTHGQM